MHVLDNAIPDKFDLFIRLGAVLHDLRGAQLIPPVDDVDFRGEARQEIRLFHGRIASADHGENFVTKEGAVTGRASGNAVPQQTAFIFQADVTRRRSGGDDHRAGRERLCAIDKQAKRSLGEVDRRHGAKTHIRTESLGLSLEFHHHVRAHDAIGETRVILDIRRSDQLASPFGALKQQGGEVGSGGINRGREPGRPGPDDKDTAMLGGREINVFKRREIPCVRVGLLACF